MMVVSDLEDMFVPLVDGFLVTLSESEAVIDRSDFFLFLISAVQFIIIC